MNLRSVRRGAFAALPVLLLAAAILSGLVHTRAERAFYGFNEADRPYIEQSVRNLASHFGKSPDDFAKRTYPCVVHLSDRICVELPSTERYGTGHYQACFDRQSGEMVDERVSVGF